MNSMELKSRKRRFKFTNRRHSGRAAVSVCLSAISLLTFFVCLYLGYTSGGKTTRLVTSIAMIAFFLQVISLAVSIGARKEEEIFMTLPNVSLALGVMGLLPWVYVYILGIVG